MKIILLSGGSGKRLWPLSNATRSKQFLKLLEVSHGKNESMVQRVTRQIIESGLTDSIIIATSEKQNEYIKSQLGEKVEVVTEPERRDTFPAIALATSFLAYQKKCSYDETIVVMPCDSFVDMEYFKTIKNMADIVSENVADLVLMGITPTTPSTKFGYIIPSKTEIDFSFRKVEQFTEKPNVIQAQKLISLDAMWNGGVFAFKLGYMLKIAEQYINTDNFIEFRNNYSKLPQISFDYEVVEKANSVAVVSYNGVWKDLGTWNSLTEELHQNTFGNVKCGKYVKNCHIINEMDLPVICDGIENLIIAVSPDGILICDKNRSEEIKELVD